jgi:hypothetical protein
MLPSRYFIDYEALLLNARQESAADPSSFLQGSLPLLWRDAYLIAISHEPNLVRFRHRTFEYICDLYSQLEMTGSVPYGQTIADRVIGVFGMSSRAQETRLKNESNCFSMTTRHSPLRTLRRWTRRQSRLLFPSKSSMNTIFCETWLADRCLPRCA